MDSRVRDIRDISPFSALSRNERITAALSSSFHEWKHGDCLFHVDEPSGEVVVLLSGVVRLYRAAGDGNEVTIAIVSSGHIVNIGALAGCVSQDVAAEAVGTARTIHILTNSFLALITQCPSFFEAVLRELLLHTGSLYADATATAPLATRVLDLLHRVARPPSPGQYSTGIRPLAHRLTQAEIARFVGAHRSSVARALTALEEQDLVRRERGRITCVYNLGTEIENEQWQTHHRW